MSRYIVDQRIVSRTGDVNLGWHCGHGYVHRTLCVKKEVWCVMHETKIIAECRSKRAAEEIAMAMNNA